MLAQFKRLGADSLLYAFMNVGTKLIAFIMLPIYTHYMPPEIYASLDKVDRWTAMLTFLIIFGTDSALSFYYFDTKDKEKRLEHVRNVMFFRIGVVLLLGLAVVVAGPFFSRIILGSTKHVDLLYLSVGGLLFDTVTVVVLMVLRFEFNTKKVVIYTVGKMLLMAILSYLFIVFFSHTPKSILLGRMVAMIVIFVMLLSVSRKFLILKISMDSMKELLKYAAPLVPASLSFWVIANASVFFLQEFQNDKAVGIYGAASKLAMIISLITNGIQLAWRPYSMSIKDKKDSPQLFAKIYIGLLLVGILGVTAIATVMPFLIKILGTGYYQSYQYVAFLSAATFLTFYYLIISVGLFFTKQTKAISTAFAIVAVVNTILNLILIPKFSIWGAVISYLIAYMVANVFIFWKSQKVYYVPVSLAKMSYLFLSMVAAVAAIIYVQQTGLSPIYILAAWAALLILVGISRVDKDLRRKAPVPAEGTAG